MNLRTFRSIPIEIIILLVLLAMVYLFALSRTLFYFINTFSNYTGTFLWANLTILGDGLVGSVIFLVFIRKKPQLVWTALLAAVVALLMVHTLKPILDIARPPAVLEPDSFTIIGPTLKYRAFPSGHTATIFTIAGVFTLFFRAYWQRISLFTFGLLVGVSRIIVGVHWPLDVLAGALIGLISALIGFRIVKKLKWQANRTAQLIIGGLLIIATLVLLISHNTHYAQAIWLQRIYAVLILGIGGIEYFKLIRWIDFKS